MPFSLSLLLLCNSGVFLWNDSAYTEDSDRLTASQWHLVLCGTDQERGPVFFGDNRVSPRALGAAWRVPVKGSPLWLPQGCQHPRPRAGTAVVRDPALRHRQKWPHPSGFCFRTTSARVTLGLPPLLVLARISFTVFRWGRSSTVDRGQAKV